MYSPLSKLLLVFSVVFVLLGALGILAPGSNLIQPAAAMRGSILMLTDGILTIATLYYLDRRVRRVGVLLTLVAGSLALAFIAASSMFAGFPI